MYLSRNFGQIVRDCRERKKWTLEYAAELCGMSVKGLEKIELGDSNPKLSTIIKLANVLDMDIGILKKCVYFEHEENMVG